MKNQELARLFYREVLKTHQNETLDTNGKIDALYRQLNLLFVEATREEKLQFTTLFARIAFAGHKFNLNKQLQFYIHEFRRIARQLGRSKANENIDPTLSFQLGLKVLTLSISSVFKTGIPGDLAEQLPPDGFYKVVPRKIKEFKAFARVVALEDRKDQDQLLIRDEENPSEEVFLQYNIADRNENFNPSIKAIRGIFKFPVILNLIDVEIDNDGVYRPRAFVIEPDYLIDVSAISECFKDGTVVSWVHLLKKYLPVHANKYLMIGNIANFFLDELMTNPEATFKETFPKVFRLNPLAFTVFENREVREIMQSSQKHFLNLKRMVAQDFMENDINPEHCFLEPSFYAERYGIQGRLDVFHKNPDNDKDSAIVELKSGKAYKPNRWGISQNHYIQTLLYDLMIKSVFEQRLSPTNFILYSGVDERQLRFAPVTKSNQFEAIQVRNQLVALEQSLIQLNHVKKNPTPHLFDRLNPARMPQIQGFLKRDLDLFYKVYTGMNDLEQKYFNAYSGFIAREHQLAKTGVQGIDNVNGLASLWLNDPIEKQANFDIISFLEIQEIKAKEESPLIIFHKTENTSQLANFRNGDIAVLYPLDENAKGVLSNQIFKCTIIEINKTEVIIRLRSRQFNESIFHQYQHWNLEHDLFDSGFNSMYRSLFKFIQFPKEKKDLLLTTGAPRKAAPEEIKAPPQLTEEQGEIFAKAISAPDYFLLWGPPGTGKTSVMLRQLVSYILNETDENILLLAYTNRAVDEICESIESIDDYITQEYIRIGSNYSTADRFKKQLLQSKIEKVTNRQDLKEVIESHRIFVSTVASIASKHELLQLKKFHRVIIDEASQILEPILVGLLPQFERFILIGDHKQLPAVVVQNQEESATTAKALQDIGLHNLRDSLFERLFKRCEANAWDWAFARLSHQGRMHQHIMDFPNEYFYQGFLDILPANFPTSQQQIAALEYQLPIDATELETQLCQQRMHFIPTQTDQDSPTSKTNLHEAESIATLVESFHRIFDINNKKINANSIGIITPYRAQIAQIRETLQARKIDTDLLTIDTVERYQGGAREVILISLCVNKKSQLESLVSASGEGVDRKLNVALTRARQHLVLVGNSSILQQNDIYKELINFCSIDSLSS